MCWGGGGFCVAAVHFARQAFEFGEGDVGGAAFEFRFLHQFAVSIKVCGFGREAAFGGKRRGEDVGGVVQVVLRVAADELFVLGEGDVAFEDARAFTRPGEIRIAGVFRELERGAAVTDGKFGFLRRLLGAGEQLLFECAVFKIVDEIERAHAVSQRLLFSLRLDGNGSEDGEDEGSFHVGLLCEIHGHFTPIFAVFLWNLVIFLKHSPFRGFTYS